MVRDRTPLQLGSPAPSSLGSAPASRGLVSSLHLAHCVRQLETTTRYFNFNFKSSIRQTWNSGTVERMSMMMEVTRKRELTMTSTLAQYSTVQYNTVQLLTLAAREESGSSVRRHSRVRSWAQHMPCRYIRVCGDCSATAVVRPHLELVLVLLRVHAVVHDGQQPGGALQGVGAARLWRLGR